MSDALEVFPGDAEFVRLIARAERNGLCVVDPDGRGIRLTAKGADLIDADVEEGQQISGEVFLSVMQEERDGRAAS